MPPRHGEKMDATHEISSDHLSLSKLKEIIEGNYKLALSASARDKIISCRNYLDEKLKNSDAAFYGINTGFGSLRNIKISEDQIEKLQENLVMSHACGLGDEVPQEIVKLMLLLKIQSLSYGNSGVDITTVWRLIDFYNLHIIPVVYQKGSLGASGDLAPLAHLSLPLIGMGEVNYSQGIPSEEGRKIASAEILKAFNWKPLQLKSKEGLAMLNGTQFMSAYGSYLLLQAKKYSALADLISCISIDAFDCRLDPFNHLIHNVRPHEGQMDTAKNILKILEGSEIAAQEKTDVQDPYSFRCIPQVHGASKDAIGYCEKVFTTEINSVTDNPNIFPDEDLILSGGNFHGQPLAIALDFLAIALAELGSISERRTYLLISGQRNLPPFLVSNPGLNSGMMIPQYTAASMVSENKQLCTPASVDSITSSNGQEDHVSMGANAATKCFRVMKNLEAILAIELLNAAQAIEFRKPKKSSKQIEGFIQQYRLVVSFNNYDRTLHTDIQSTIGFLHSQFSE
ncbi:MAG: histidine ammonia-lyase [Chitinophagales bacterium]|nr:histidine ammonia-lyase [Chitinophagales bacterium]